MKLLREALSLWAKTGEITGLDVLGGWERTTSRWTNELAHRSSPSGYGDWKLAVKELAGLAILRKAQDRFEALGFQNPAAHVTQIGYGQRAATVQLKTHGPFIWLSLPLMERFIDSEPMALPEDVRKPFPAFTLMLPEHPDLVLEGVPVRSLSIAHADRDHPDGVDAILEPAINHPEARHNLFLYARTDTERSVSYVIWSDDAGKVHQPKTLLVPTRRRADGMTLEAAEVEDPSESDDPYVRARERLHQTLSAIAVNTVMVMNFRGDLLGEAPEPRSKRKGQFPAFNEKTARPLRWLGENYRSPASADHGGSHSSPRMHLRRAHWRSQPYGPGRTKRRWTWIDHILVNSDHA